MKSDRFHTKFVGRSIRTRLGAFAAGWLSSERRPNWVLGGLAVMAVILGIFLYPGSFPVKAQIQVTGTPSPTANTSVPSPQATQVNLGGKLALIAPDIRSFPVISAYLSAHAADGSFINMIQPGQVSVLEDNHPMPIEELQLVQPGVRVIVAINAGAPMGVRNGQGQTRFDQVTSALQDWINLPATATNQDDFSLLTNQGTPNTGMNNPADWLAALNAYQPDLRKVQPSLDSLSAALLLANDTTPRPGMGRSILFITTLPDPATMSPLSDLIGRANQAGVAVNIWLVGSQSDFDSDAALPLQKLASQTGGSFFTFSGKEALPNPEAYFKNLRGMYSLRYTSAINQSGSHTLAVKVSGLASDLNSPVQFFNLTIIPPNPMFLSPPVTVTRSEPGSTSSLADLIPKTQTIQILVEFPDGHTRPLRYSRLYVDGRLVDENASAPFDKFTWDLSSYTSKGQHNLRVEIQDSLGLVRSSISMPVELDLAVPSPTPASLLSQLKPWIGPAIAILVTIGLLIIIVINWRKLQKAVQTQLLSRKKELDTRSLAARAENHKQNRPGWAEHLAWPRRLPQEQVGEAQFLRLDDNNQVLTSVPITVAGREMTFGSDPMLSTCVLDSACVEPLHTRLKQNEDGNYYLFDEGSVAGTWVNFISVSTEGVLLKHGDQIHIGTIPFRFITGRLSHLRKLTVKTYNESQ